MNNLIADRRGNPSPLTKYAASTIVGVAAAAVVGAVYKKNPAPALLAMLFVVVAHQKYDAPVARLIVGGARDVGLA